MLKFTKNIGNKKFDNTSSFRLTNNQPRLNSKSNHRAISPLAFRNAKIDLGKSFFGVLFMVCYTLGYFIVQVLLKIGRECFGDA